MLWSASWGCPQEANLQRLGYPCSGHLGQGLAQRYHRKSDAHDPSCGVKLDEGNNRGGVFVGVQQFCWQLPAGADLEALD